MRIKVTAYLEADEDMIPIAADGKLTEFRQEVEYLFENLDGVELKSLQLIRQGK